MNGPTENGRIGDGLAGEIAALKLAVIALIKCSPQRQAVRDTFLQDSEELISNTLSSPFPDAAAEMMAQTRDLILRRTGDPA